MIDLGWANDWKQDPEILIKCRELKHAEQGLTESHSDNRRCISTYLCKECGYTYSVDSSD